MYSSGYSCEVPPETVSVILDSNGYMLNSAVAASSETVSVPDPTSVNVLLVTASPERVGDGPAAPKSGITSLSRPPPISKRVPDPAKRLSA